MLRIERRANGEVVFAVSGRLSAENLGELAALLAAEPPGKTLGLDLKDVVLVDREIVQFLQGCIRNGVTLNNCPPYIREWIEQEENES